MAWNYNSTLLASASAKGTVIRVHRLPQACMALLQGMPCLRSASTQASKGHLS